jgi:hypothetical protein
VAKLFDEKTGLIRLDEIVYESKRFQMIMADGVVSDEEIVEQAELVTRLFQEIETSFSERDKELVAQTVSELAVLYEINAHRGGK